MFRRIVALLAAATLALIGLAGTASAVVTGPDRIYVATADRGWVAESQLTAAEYVALAAQCAPLQYAVAVDQLTQASIKTDAAGHLSHLYGTTADGLYLIDPATATTLQMDYANAHALARPAGAPQFLGPTSYAVSFAADGTPTYSCVR